MLPSPIRARPRLTVRLSLEPGPGIGTFAAHHMGFICFGLNSIVSRARHQYPGVNV